MILSAGYFVITANQMLGSDVVGETPPVLPSLLPVAGRGQVTLGVPFHQLPSFLPLSKEPFLPYSQIFNVWKVRNFVPGPWNIVCFVSGLASQPFPSFQLSRCCVSQVVGTVQSQDGQAPPFFPSRGRLSFAARPIKDPSSTLQQSRFYFRQAPRPCSSHRTVRRDPATVR